MPFSLDPEISAKVDGLFADFGEIKPMAVGDVEARREAFDELQRVLFGQKELPNDVKIQEFETAAADGARLHLRWYSADDGVKPGSAVLYVHGGGMIASHAEIYDVPVSHYVSATGVPFLSVEYRYAPEFPAPVPVLDCYAALQWLAEHAADLGVDPSRIAVMGDSAGGGIAASLAIYARDRAREHAGPAIARQILVYPMLDDRNLVPDPQLVTWLPWSYDDNVTGWGALLGSDLAGPDVSPYGAASRVEDFNDLPSAYIEVGELDIFRDESVLYAQKLWAAGVSTELHVHPHVPHAFDAFVPDAEISRRVIKDRERVLGAI